MRPRRRDAPSARHANVKNVQEPTLAAVVRAQTGVAWSRARALCTEGRVSIDGQRCVDPACRVAPRSVVAVEQRAPAERPGALAAGAIVFADRDIVVVDKPAGMLSVPDEPRTKGTLAQHARTLLRSMQAGPDVPLGVVHRLDRETSGVLVFARSAEAQRKLAAQFRAHAIDRRYRAIVHGAVEAARVDTVLVVDRGDGLRGSLGHFRRARGHPPPEGRRAVTHVEPIAALAGATLVECRLETGRQHQIRIHLAELGHPLVGETVYIRDYAGARIASPRTMLHALSLGFVHPRSGERVEFRRDPPQDFSATVESLRAR